MIKNFLILLVFILNVFIVNAHGNNLGLEGSLKSTALNYILLASLIVSILILYSIFKKRMSERQKLTIFIIIVVVVLFVTIYSAASTIYLNVISETKGPIHWHADFEIWNCNKEIDLIKPRGLSNRVGSPTLHEHGDNRIHVEGVVLKKEDVNLHSFFESINGELKQDYLKIPTDHGIVEIRNNELCNNEPGKIQVFAYKVINPEFTKKWKYTQEKIQDFENYILSPYSNVPPGDCIIIEFDQEKQFTDKICDSYKLSIEKGELSGN